MTRRARHGLVGTGAAPAALATHDLLQKKHSVLRNYPVIGHMRYLLEELRPELQQYTRSIIYERSKGIHGEKAFGTERDVSRPGYEYLVHSTAPLDPPPEPPRVLIGGLAAPGELIDATRAGAADWQAASAQSFTPQLAQHG